jgi:hypothetical protein
MCRVRVITFAVIAGLYWFGPVQARAVIQKSASTAILRVRDTAPRGINISPRRPADLDFSFPKGAKQGPNEWYTVTLHARVVIAQNARKNVAYLTVSTSVPGEKNRWTSAQIEFDIKPKRHHTMVDVSSIGILRGLTHFETRKRIIEIAFTNYLQKRGVKGGRSDLHVELEGLLRPYAITSAIVLPDTKVSETEISPPHLRIRVRPVTRDPLVVGRVYAMKWKLSNDSRIPARAVDIDLEDFYGGIKVLGKSHYYYKELKGSVSGLFRYVPERSGRIEYYVSVGSTTANQPAVRIDTTVFPKTRSDNREIELLRVLGIVLIAFVIGSGVIKRTAHKDKQAGRLKRPYILPPDSEE